jgi:hypothetical protein
MIEIICDTSERPGFVRVTTEEAVAWATLYGFIATVTDPDGQMWRLLEPWEDGPSADA